MFQALRINKSYCEKQQNNRGNYFVCCITLRQWAILFSILIFIITAIITTSMVLATIHDKQIQRLLEDDIHEEKEKHKNEFNNKQSHGKNSNEIKLRFSLSFVKQTANFFTICMWLGWLNLILAAFLIYGVTTTTCIYILPWILFSGITYLLALITIAVANFRFNLSINYTILLVFSASSMIFLEMWYTIVLYYLNIRKTRCERNISFNPTVIHAYGGYMHTIQPVLGDVKKPLV